MPLDPSIIGRGAPSTPIASPFEALQTVAQFQAIREQTEARRLAADAARQKAADEAAVRRIFTETGGDMAQALPRIRQVAPGAAAALEKEWAAAQKDHIETASKHVTLTGQKLDLGGKLASFITDQASWDLVLPMIATQSPDLAQVLGPTYHPEKLAHLNDMLLSAKERNDAHREAIKLATDGKPQESYQTALAAIDPKAPDAPAQWAQVQQSYRGLLSADLVATAGDFSPENHARVTRGAIGPTKQAELAGQAATRAQTQAHQAVEEQISRGNLDVARGHLGVSRAAEARQAAGGGVKLTAAQQEDIATMLTVEQLAQEVQAIDTKAGELPGVGPLAGRFGASLRGSGGATGETLRNTIGNIQGTIAKLRGGTSFTPSEQALLDTYTPTTTDTDAAIRTKLTTLVDFIQKKRTNTLRVAAGQYTLPADAETGGNRVTAPNGKTYTFASAAEAAAFKKRAGIP